MRRFVDGKFSSTFISTVGVDFKSKVLPIDGQSVKVNVWDTAGQERFRAISLSFLRGAQGIALVFDLTNRKSFEHVTDWIRQVKESAESGIPMCLFANKADLVDRYAVTKEEATSAAGELGVPLFFTSAKSAECVNDAFAALAQHAGRRLLEMKAKAAAASRRVVA